MRVDCGQDPETLRLLPDWEEKQAALTEAKAAEADLHQVLAQVEVACACARHAHRVTGSSIVTGGGAGSECRCPARCQGAALDARVT